MKLLFVHDGPIVIDGDGRYHSYSYENIDKRYSMFSHEISLLIRVKQSENERKMSFIPDSIKIIEVPNYKSLKNYFLNKQKAKKIIKNAVLNTDMLILKMHSSNAFLAYKYAKRYKKPFLVEYVSCAWDSYWNYSLIGKIIAPIMELQTKIVAKNSMYNYYVTKSFLQKHYPSKGMSLGCSDVVLKNFDESVIETRINKLKNINRSSKIIFGTAASLDVKYKGQQYVIAALSRLRKEGYNVEYHLAGGHNPNNNYLEKVAKKYKVENCVIYSGMYDNTAINNFYDSIDIYIQPSKQEGLPRSVVEAMSRGCPVIGSDIAGIPELIDKEYRFKKGRVSDLMKKLKMIINSDLSKVARRNYEKSKEFDVNLLNKLREQFYESVNEDILRNKK